MRPAFKSGVASGNLDYIQSDVFGNRVPVTRQVLRFVRRLFMLSELDFEYAGTHIVYLLLRPSKVYQLVAYQRMSSGEPLRDDPSFYVLQVYMLIASSVAHGVCFSEGFSELMLTVFFFVFVQYLGLGLLVSWLSIRSCDKFGRAAKQSSQPEATTAIGQNRATSPNRTSQDSVRSVSDVEAVRGGQQHGPRVPISFRFAFDVHANAFFPVFILLYIVQFLLIPVLLRDSYSSAFIANSLHVAAVWYYCVLTSLGYSYLSFIKRADFFMYPAVLFTLFGLILWAFRVNLSSWFYTVATL